MSTSKNKPIPNTIEINNISSIISSKKSINNLNNSVDTIPEEILEKIEWDFYETNVPSQEFIKIAAKKYKYPEKLIHKYCYKNRWYTKRQIIKEEAKKEKLESMISQKIYSDSSSSNKKTLEVYSKLDNLLDYLNHKIDEVRYSDLDTKTIESLTRIIHNTREIKKDIDKEIDKYKEKAKEIIKDIYEDY